MGKNYDKMEIGKLKGERAKDNIMKNQSDILSSSPSCTVTSDAVMSTSSHQMSVLVSSTCAWQVLMPLILQV